MIPPFLTCQKNEKQSDNTLLSSIDLSFNALGQIEKEDHSGSLTLWKYDSRGFPCQKTQISGTDDLDVVTTFFYNNQGQCVETRSASGNEHKDYDIVGNCIQSKLFSPAGRVLSATYFSYNLNNEPICKQTANANNILYLDYHSSGLIKASRQTINSSVACTLYEYDPCGYLTEEIDPRPHNLQRIRCSWQSEKRDQRRALHPFLL